MAAEGATYAKTIEAELALLRRRLARSESARAQAEALLEDKSRVLAQANDELKRNKELLRIELGQKTRQLLDAQRVAGFGTMVWDADALRGELSPHSQILLGMPGVAEIDSVRLILARVVPEERDRVSVWASNLSARALEIKGGCSVQSRKGRENIAEKDGQPIDCRSCEALSECERMLEVRVMGLEPTEPNRLIRVLAETVLDEILGHMLVFLTLQDITREVEIANEAEALRQQDQNRLRVLELLTDELRQAREAADAANAAKTRFLAMMSHDIRTPMNGVIGMLALFDEEGLTPEQCDTLKVVRESSDHLRILLDDIIDLERAQAGKLSLKPAPMNSETFLKGVLTFWAKAAHDRGLSFEVDRMAFGWPHRAPDWVLADRLRLRQVADNLLSNALKYTRQGGVIVRMGLVAAERLRFEVIDTGPGIPLEQRASLFEDFSQLASEGYQRTGAGLGLAICKRIVEQMEGEIGIETGTDGSGTCFWIELPWMATEPQVEFRAGEPMILRRPDGQRPRILVAEDVATNRIVAKGLLGRLGCDVELVEDGEQAVAAVREGQFDLLLMDVSMPGMDGPTAARLIRALPGAAGEVPIVALTAYSRPEELAPMLNAGAMGTVNKPIVLEEMYRVLHDICCLQHDAG